MPVLQVEAAEAAVDAGDARAMQRMTEPSKSSLKRKATNGFLWIFRVFHRSVFLMQMDMFLKLVTVIYSKDLLFSFVSP